MTLKQKPKKFTKSKAKQLLPKRKATQNKTHGGRALIIAGSPGMFGAGVLAATACARVGSGYTQLLCDLKKYSFQKNPDFLTADIKSKKISDLKFNAVAVGPGLGVGRKTLNSIGQLLKLKSSYVVLDADALSVVAKNKIFPLPKSWILTPHTGELARLMGVTSATVQAAPLKWLTKAQKKYNCVILIKGHPTYVSDGAKALSISTGTPALAKAGTGDVLTGIITGFMAQGLKPLEAGALAAFVHGMAARRWEKSKRDPLSLLASDLLKLLPETLYTLRKG